SKSKEIAVSRYALIAPVIQQKVGVQAD
ncbi:hypothetical protein HKBW3S42_01373, partial [Candidatus Hakubella thermalkaliphila]